MLGPHRVTDCTPVDERSGSGYGRGRRKTLCTVLKMTMLEAMPTARINTTIIAKRGDLASRRAAKEKSRRDELMGTSAKCTRMKAAALPSQGGSILLILSGLAQEMKLLGEE